MLKLIAEQDARIAEQMEEIWNLRQQLQLQGGGENGGNTGNPSEVEAENDQSRSENDGSSRRDYGKNQPLAAPEIQHEPLYAKFGKMKLAQIAGSTDPLEAEEWISSIETILDFM